MTHLREHRAGHGAGAAALAATADGDDRHPYHHRRHQRRRVLARSERSEVSGSVHLGYFTARVEFGSPAPQAFDLITDTGSTLTYVPCKGCARCGAHASPPFDAARSATARNVSCGDGVCRARAQAVMRCDVGLDRCYYSLSYAESSSSQGFLIRDGAPRRAAVCVCFMWVGC